MFLPLAILLWFFVARDNDILFDLNFKDCNKQYDEKMLEQCQLIQGQIINEIVKRQL